MGGEDWSTAWVARAVLPGWVESTGLQDWRGLVYRIGKGWSTGLERTGIQDGWRGLVYRMDGEDLSTG